MKLQYHKIRGVDKSVCTAEQKIAYNMASRIYGDIRFAKAWQQYDSGKVPAFLIPSDHPEYKGIFADRREIPAADLDSITWF